MDLKFGLISADDHVQEHPEVWTSRLSKAKWGDRIPHVEASGGVERWVVDGEPVALTGVASAGALMPDAHQGYGLPIGGVLATENSVIPYAVGVDIACRMRLTVFNASPIVLEQKRDKFRKILEDKTRFGRGASWDEPREHEVMDDPAWKTLAVARRLKDKAWDQLGTSGSGNHFVEFFP